MLTKFRATLRGIAALVFALLVAQTPAFGQTIATYTLGSGWATFGLGLPQGAARGGVRVGALQTQTDVKTSWPDGSIRFAVVTTNVPAGGTYAITSGPAAVGTLAPIWPTAEVTFVIGGTTYTATLPAFVGTNSWLGAGSLVRESRVVVAPMSGGTPHPLLQVIFDVRSYASAGHRVDVTVQNVKDSPAGNNVVYNVGVVLNGSTVYSKTAVDHRYLTRWRKVFTTAGFREATVRPDIEPFIAAGAVPRFVATVDNPSPGTIGTNAAFDILGFGGMAVNMGDPGARPELAYYPNWVAQYLVHKDPGVRELMLRSADLSGSWSGHITEPDGTTLISLDSYPDYWLDSRSLGHPIGPSVLNGTGPMLETAHMPGLTYVPYLLTGDRYYLDQLKLWANFAMLATWPGDPNAPRTGAGVLAQNQIRGIAWGLRMLGDAAASVPDGTPEKTYFSVRVQANLDWLNNYALTTGGGPTGAIFLGKYGTDTGGFVPPYGFLIPPWEYAMVAWSLDHIGHLGFTPVAAMRDRLLRFNLGMFTDSGFDRNRVGAQFVVPARVYSGTTVSFFTFGQMYCETFGCPPRADSQTPLVGYYGPDLRAGLILAKQAGMGGTDEPLAWLQSQPGMWADVNARSGFAIIPDTASGPAPTAPRQFRAVP